MQIVWTAPVNKVKDKILGYNVFINSSSDEFIELKTCNFTNATTCVFPMSVLSRHKTGSLIRVKVRAFNLKGNGTLSRTNVDQVKVEHTPGRMTTPRGKVNPEKNEIAIEWDRFSLTGGAPILSYDL